MAKLFQSEMTKMRVKGQPSFDKEAEDLRYSSTARKRSLLPKGSNSIILYIFNINMFLNTKKIVFPEFDEKEVTVTTENVKLVDKEIPILTESEAQVEKVAAISTGNEVEPKNSAQIVAPVKKGRKKGRINRIKCRNKF